jgi:hypothetical protein
MANDDSSIEGISNVYIERQMGKLNLANYVGCYSVNTVPVTQLAPNSSFICNVSKKNEPGTHFIAVKLDGERGLLYYYDSFGLLSAALSSEINTLLRDVADFFYLDVKFVLREPVQDLRSSFCAFYSMLYTVLSDDVTTISRIISAKLKEFNSIDLLKNDDVVISNLCAIIKQLS